MKGKTLCLIVAIAAMVSLIGYPAHAEPLTLTDLNSTAIIAPASQAGMHTWTVDGVDHLYQQWFWYRVGSTGPEASINTLQISGATAAGRSASVIYTGAGFTIDILYTLTGGTAGSNTSDIAESIRIINTGTTALDFHFFQYSDFDLGGSSNDTVQRTNANAIVQFDPLAILSETVVSPSPNHYQLALYPGLLNLLNDESATTLSDGPAILGPGDVSWAFEWDTTLGVGGSLIISKDKRLVPEPVSMLLLGLGLVGLAGVRRFRK